MKKIFLDMDGVIADFAGLYCKVNNVPTVEDNFSAHMWEKFVVHEDGFRYVNLLPGAMYLIRQLRELDKLNGVSVSILGSTGGYEYHGLVQDQKIAWLKKHGITFPPIFVPGKRFKQYHATKSSILIDDHPKNCEQFAAMGGSTHLYKNDPEAAVISVISFIEKK
jgi:5'(3')-deoxyribonucleotidase